MVDIALYLTMEGTHFHNLFLGNVTHVRTYKSTKKKRASEFRFPRAKVNPFRSFFSFCSIT